MSDDSERSPAANPAISRRLACCPGAMSPDPDSPRFAGLFPEPVEGQDDTNRLIGFADNISSCPGSFAAVEYGASRLCRVSPAESAYTGKHEEHGTHCDDRRSSGRPPRIHQARVVCCSCRPTSMGHLVKHSGKASGLRAHKTLRISSCDGSPFGKSTRNGKFF